jgi:hypothetical protein
MFEDLKVRLDPEALERGERIVFGYNNRWTCATRIECTCECNKRHFGWIMRHRYECQLWWDEDDIWDRCVTLKCWNKEEKKKKKLAELKSE